MSDSAKATSAGAVYLAHRDEIERAIAVVCTHERLPRDIAEDFAQDVRLRFVERGARILDRYEERSALSTYLFRVVANQFQNWNQARRRAQLSPMTDISRQWPAPPAPAAIEQAEDADRTMHVLDALAAERARLSVDERLLLLLRFELVSDLRQVALEMEITPKAASGRLSRLMRSLEERLLGAGVPRQEVTQALEYLHDHGAPPPRS